MAPHTDASSTSITATDLILIVVLVVVGAIAVAALSIVMVNHRRRARMADPPVYDRNKQSDAAPAFRARVRTNELIFNPVFAGNASLQRSDTMWGNVAFRNEDDVMEA